MVGAGVCDGRVPHFVCAQNKVISKLSDGDLTIISSKYWGFFAAVDCLRSTRVALVKWKEEKLVSKLYCVTLNIS